MLAAYDHHIRAVYLFEESTNPDAETEDYLLHVDLTIHLLVKVTSGSAALEAFVTIPEVENTIYLIGRHFSGHLQIAHIFVTKQDRRLELSNSSSERWATAVVPYVYLAISFITNLHSIGAG